MSDNPADIPKKSKRRFYILIVLCILGAIVLKLNFIFFAIGMLPAMVAYLIDHDKHKYIFSTVAAMNFAGVFPDMMDIYLQGSTFGVVKEKLADPMVWLIMYSAAGLGWVLVWLSPRIAAIFIESLYAGRILHLESQQRKLEEEWGPELMRKDGQNE